VTAEGGATALAVMAASSFVLFSFGACNTTHVLGQTGGALDGGSDAGAPPVSTLPLGDIRQVSGGDQHLCALSRSGDVYCWGDNQAGELGDGTKRGRPWPARVVGLGRVVQISANNRQTCALVEDASAWCWGGAFQPGAPSLSRLRPAVVPDLGTAVEIAAVGDGFCARLTDGTVRCRAQATDDAGTSLAATPVPGLADVIRIAGHQDYACVVTGDGRARCFDVSGRDPTVVPRGTAPGEPELSPVSGVTAAVEVAAGWGHACARVEGGSIYCWGFNLGEKPLGVVQEPRLVPGLTGTSALALGGNHLCAVTSGVVDCWGQFTVIPRQFSDRWIAEPQRIAGLTEVTHIGAAAAATCAGMTDGTLRCWGKHGLAAKEDVDGLVTPAVLETPGEVGP
jgi:hypothetical protein